MVSSGSMMRETIWLKTSGKDFTEDVSFKMTSAEQVKRRKGIPREGKNILRDMEGKN